MRFVRYSEGVNEAGNLHCIQVNIIRRLSETAPLRFSELQAPNLPNNVFAYHLKQLIEKGYVKQNEHGRYEPTRKSLKILSYTDENAGRRDRSPLMLTMLFIEDSDRRVLLLERKHQPFPGFYGLPSGPIHNDERVEDAARRELAEKTGIRSSRPLRYIGVLDFRYLHSETSDVFVHAVTFVYGHTLPDDVRPTIADDTYIWSNIDHGHILPEVNAVKMMAQATTPGVTSLSFTEPSL